MGLSGGMDSATLLGILLDQGYEVHCCSFKYGSKHMDYEMDSAEDIVIYYLERGFPVHRHIFDLREVFHPFDSALLNNTGEQIPEGHYNDENMKRTVVPGRNMIMASIMAGYAESIKADAIALGVHSGDHHIYPDCRPEFIKFLNLAILNSSDGNIRVETPLLYEDKFSILKIGYALNPAVPYHLTRTCYKDQSESCGKCGSCQERLEAFGKLGIKDPIAYEDDERDAE